MYVYVRIPSECGVLGAVGAVVARYDFREKSVALVSDAIVVVECTTSNVPNSVGDAGTQVVLRGHDEDC